MDPIPGSPNTDSFVRSLEERAYKVLLELSDTTVTPNCMYIVVGAEVQSVEERSRIGCALRTDISRGAASVLPDADW